MWTVKTVGCAELDVSSPRLPALHPRLLLSYSGPAARLPAASRRRPAARLGGGCLRHRPSQDPLSHPTAGCAEQVQVRVLILVDFALVWSSLVFCVWFGLNFSQSCTFECGMGYTLPYFGSFSSPEPQKRCAINQDTMVVSITEAQNMTSVHDWGKMKQPLLCKKPRL